MSKKKLFLFTADFPYGNGETFLETEIKHLAKGFDEVEIISLNTKDKQTRELPSNIDPSRFDLNLSALKKLMAIKGIFSSLFWQEIGIVRREYGMKLNPGIIKTILISLSRSKLVEHKCSQLITDASSSEKLYFYSYWCDDVALGLSRIQRKDPNIRTFCRIHRWDVYFEESSVSYLPFRHFIVNNISKIYSISQDGIDYAIRVWKIDLTNKFEVSRLGIDREGHFEAKRHENLLLVSCSNMIAVKRVHLIPEALKQVNDQKIRWVHIGDGPERSKVEELISDLPKNIEVDLLGRVPNTEIYKYYRQHKPDLFINVSSSEGVPVSIMEAMSFGIPVIATEVGGNKEIVNSGNGILLKADPTLNEIASAIQAFNSSSAELKEAFQKNSFETWKKNYNASINYSAFLADILSM